MQVVRHRGFERSQALDGTCDRSAHDPGEHDAGQHDVAGEAELRAEAGLPAG